MKLYKTTEFAKKIGISRRTLLNWEKEGKIKPFAYNEKGHRLYIQQQVDEFLEVEQIEKIEKDIVDEVTNDSEKKKYNNDFDKNTDNRIIELLEREISFLKEQLKIKDEQLSSKEDIIKREQELRLLADKKIIMLEDKNNNVDSGISEIEKLESKPWWKFW